MSRPSGASSASQLGLGLAMGVGNALSYAFVLILTRLLGPADFGAYSAINTLGIVFVIPAGVLQVVVASRWVRPGEQTTGLRAASVIGVVLTGVTLALAWPLANIFHLHSPAPVVAMAAMLWPMTMTGALGGLMLGAQRLGALSVQYLVTAGTRVGAAWVCAVAGASLTEVFLATAVASFLTLAVGWWMCRDLVVAGADDRSTTSAATKPHLSSSASTAQPVTRRSLWRELAVGSSTLAAFTVLTNVDVVLARHFLNPADSGGYGLASTFGRAMCWGTQFVALLVIPRVTVRGASATVRACGLIVAIGAAAGAVLSISPDWFVRIAGGSQFSGYGPLMLACVCLGTLWALVQLFLFSGMAQASSRLGTLTWIVAAVQGVVGWLWLHETTAQIITLSAIGALLIVSVAFANIATSKRAKPRGETAASRIRK